MANAQAQRTLDISAMDIFNLAIENGIFGQFLHIFANDSVQLQPAWRNNLILFVRSRNLTTSGEAQHGLLKAYQSRNHSK